MLTAVLLLLSTLATDVSRSRTLTVPRSLERTVARLAIGLAATYGDEARLPSVAELLEGDIGAGISIHESRLLLAGRREGSPAGRTVRAVYSLVRFALDLGSPSESVEFRYTLGYRGLAIARRVIVTEGQIVSLASFPCRLGPQGRVRHVWIAVTARDAPRGCAITTAATVRVNTGLCAARSRSRCGLVNSVATKMIRKQLDGMLLGVEREGRQVSAAGHDALLARMRQLTDRLLRWTR